MNIIFANVFGFMALIMSVYMYQANNKSTLFLRQIIYTIFMLIEFILLNAYTALIVSLISFLRAIVFYYSDKENKKVSNYFILLIIILFLVTLLFTYKNIFSLIPVFIGISYTLSLQIKNVNQIKKICLLLSILWIIYYIVIKGYISIITRIIDIIAIFYSLKKDFKK